MKTRHVCVWLVLVALSLPCGISAAQDDQLPFDVEYALAVAAAEIMHQPPAAEDAAVDPAAASELQADEFSFAGFEAAGATLESYGPGSGGENSRTLDAVIQFSDKYNRGALTYVSLDYRADEQGFRMLGASSRPVAPCEPRVFVYFVPSSAVREAGTQIYGSWESLYDFVLANAVRAGSSPDRGQYNGFIFCMDRVAPDADFYPIVSRKEREKNKRKSIAKSEVLDYDGWKVALVAGKLQLENPGKRFYVNVFYQPGADAPEDYRETRRVAQFASAE